MTNRWHHYEWELLQAPAMHPALHMALDEILLDQVSKGLRKPTLRFWEWATSSVIIGRFQSLKNEVDSQQAERHGLSVVRRISGGGAMFLEPGNGITYSIYAPEALVAGLNFQESYLTLDAWVVEGLKSLGVNAWYQPLNDITSDGGKIGGAAQARRNNAVLHHTMLAYDMDADKMVQVLRIGQEKLSDKGTTSAKKRVDPLRRQTGLSREEISQRLVQQFAQSAPLSSGVLDAATLQEAADLAQSKYQSFEWTALVP